MTPMTRSSQLQTGKEPCCLTLRRSEFPSHHQVMEAWAPGKSPHLGQVSCSGAWTTTQGCSTALVPKAHGTWDPQHPHRAGSLQTRAPPSPARSRRAESGFHSTPGESTPGFQFEQLREEVLRCLCMPRCGQRPMQEEKGQEGERTRRGRRKS